MPNQVRKRSMKSGLPPGTPVHIGSQRTPTTQVILRIYNETEWEEREISQLSECPPLTAPGRITWINVSGLHQVERLEELNACLGLHPLVLEDILNTEQRPKIEDYGDYLFIVFKSLFLSRQRNRELTGEQISLVLGKNFLLSFQERDNPLWEPVVERLRGGKGRIRKMGPDYLAHALMDAVIDHYFVVLEELGERIEQLEEEVVARPRSATHQTIHRLKQETLHFRRSVWPMREIVGALTREESPLVGESTRFYLRDLADHLIQVLDNLETFREMLSAMTDIYLASNSNRMNEIMKVLTIIATLFIPLTFIAGIYGMNFQFMPELSWPWGYPLVLLLMLAVALFMLGYFRRKKWL